MPIKINSGKVCESHTSQKSFRKGIVGKNLPQSIIKSILIKAIIQ